MSFLRKLAEKATPPKVSVKLNLGENIFFLGGHVKGELLVSSDEDLSATLYSAKPSLSGPIHISKGFSEKFPFSIPIPVTMKPTSKSVGRRVS